MKNNFQWEKNLFSRGFENETKREFESRLPFVADWSGEKVFAEQWELREGGGGSSGGGRDWKAKSVEGGRGKS